MKTLLYTLLLTAALTSTAAAQTNLAGKWQGRLEIAPGKTLTVQFLFTAAPGGTYTAIVTSPDSDAIKNVAAKSVTYADGKLALDVPALSGGYAGTLRNGAFEGEWSQEGAKMPLSLKPFQVRALTRGDIDTLRGEWSGKLNPPGTDIQLTIVLRFTAGADGTLGVALDVPEQGVKDWPGQAITVDEGHFAVELPKPMAKVTGLLKGEQIVGEWNQLGNSVPLTLKKGRYVAATNYLNFPPASRDQLKGRWTGTLNGLAVVVRFETDAQGRTQGFFDSTQQNLLNIPIAQGEFSGTKLTFSLAVGAKYTGDLAGDKVTGEWAQQGLPKPLPLVLTREK